MTCRFDGITALAEVNLGIAAGERVALVGPSGAGKSTLIGLCNGSLSPTAGDVSVLGKLLNQVTGRSRRHLQQQIGTVYQQHQLVDNLSVIHNVNAGQLGRWPLWKAVWSLIWPQQVEAAKRALDQLGLADKLYARTDRLSGGQQQRVALARVLLQDPDILLADEPVASVDPARAHDIMRLLCEVADSKIANGNNGKTTKTTTKTLLVSLHSVELAKRYCDRIVGLRQGHIVFDTPATAISNEQLTALYDLNS
ncbi:MAG: ATP-binding cassette domain-containing protein [Cyanobacteria bacterium J06621_11]